MKKLLLLLSMLIPWSGFGQGGITVSPPFNPANMGPIGVSGLIDSGTFALTLASSNGTVLFDVKSGPTEVIKVSDGFGQPNVHFVADEWEFGNGQASFQYPLIFWVTGAVGFDPGFGNGDTFLTRQSSSGALGIGTTKGAINGSLFVNTVTLGPSGFQFNIDNDGFGDAEIGTQLTLTGGIIATSGVINSYAGGAQFGVTGDGSDPATEFTNTSGAVALSIGPTVGTQNIGLYPNGNMNVQGIISMGGYFSYGGGSTYLVPSGGGIWRMGDGSGTAGFLAFGNNSSTQSGFKVNGTTMQSRLGDDSGFADFQGRNLILTGSSLTVNGNQAAIISGTGSASINPNGLLLGQMSETSFATAGASVGDQVVVGPPANPPSFISWAGYVSTSGTTVVRLSAIATVTGSSQSWTVKTIKK